MTHERDVQRLVREWLEHDKIILAVDFDDTIYHWRHTSQEDCDSTIELIKWCQTIGCYVMIHTAFDDSRHQEILNYCTNKGLIVDSINCNVISLPYGNEGKPFYNWQLCDRSGLLYSLTVLEDAAKAVVTEKRN